MIDHQVYQLCPIVFNRLLSRRVKDPFTVNSNFYDSTINHAFFKCTQKDLLSKFMLKFGIQRCVISTMCFSSIDLTTDSNAYIKRIAECSSQFSYRLSVPDLRSHDGVDLMHQYCRSGENNFHLKANWQGISLTDSYFSILYDILGQYIDSSRFSLMLHVDHPIQKDQRSNIQVVHNAIISKPANLSFCLEHLSGQLYRYFHYSGIKEYVLSSVPRSPYMILDAKDLLGEDLLFGSDFPFATDDEVISMLKYFLI